VIGSSKKVLGKLGSGGNSMAKYSDSPGRSIFIVVFVLVSLICAMVFIKYFQKAFPSSAIPLEIDKKQAIQNAMNFLKRMDYDVDGYKILATFQTDEETDYYLQRKLGIEKLNQLTKDNTLCLHYWRIRFYKPLTEKEFIVGIAPNGDFDGFKIIIPEHLQGERLEREAALEIAEQFVGEATDIDLSTYNLSSTSTKERDHRTDHSFIWERKWPQFSETNQEILIEVLGNRIGFFEKYIRVPESFSRAYTRERSRGNLLFTFANILSMVARIAKRKMVNWRFGLIIGISTFIITILLAVNHFHKFVISYPTSEDWGVFIAHQFMLVFISTVLLSVQMFLYGSVGKPIDDDIFQKNRYFIFDRSRNRNVLKNLLYQCGTGYGLAFILLAGHTIFYLIANNLGAWLPSKPKFSDFLLSYVPLFTIVGSAVLAALTEETAYRVFCIPFLKRYLKITWIAILIPALIWANRHAGHVVYPVYLRIIELTIIGLIYGVMYIRFGIITVMIAHYLVDAIVGVIMTMDPSLIAYKTTMLIVVLLPVAITYIIYRFQIIVPGSSYSTTNTS
jgi:hypothetical protein